MKTILLTIATAFAFLAVNAQDSLKRVLLPEHITLHFISPEPIQYVDISNKELAGDLPLKNVLRLKLRDSCSNFRDAVVTIAGEKFIAQYHLFPGPASSPSAIDIVPADTRPLDIAGIGFSQNQLKSMSMNLVARHPGKNIEKVKAFGLIAKLNHVYTLGDYIFLDISYLNRTRLRYDISDFRFSVDDKKVTKASNIQSIILKPEYVLFQVPQFDRYYRNVFVFKKFTFPGNKVFTAGMSENQLSGRFITLNISYKDLLQADTLPN